MVTLLRPRYDPGLLWYVCHALRVQVSHQRFHGATESVMRMLVAVLCKRYYHPMDVCCPSHIHGIFRQFIHSDQITCHPVSVGEIETIAPGLEKGLT